MRSRRSALPQKVRLARWLAALALIPATCCPPAVAGDLGRLFFTPERRQQLDHQRQFNVREQAVRVDPTLTIDGIVTRSSGKRTVWINGVSQSENNSAPGLSVHANRYHPGDVSVRGDGTAAASARVGETINRNTAETRSPLDGGRIVVHRASR